MENCNTKAILAFDCSTPNASVALRVDDNMRSEPIGKGRHAAALVPVIDGLLKDAAIPYSALSAMVTTLGPGSFTGLRIALATAHGIHLACGIPIKCVTTLAALAFGRAGKIRAVMAVGKGEVAYQDFNHGIAISNMTRMAEGDAGLFATDACLLGTLNHPNVQYVERIDASWLCAMADTLPITAAEDAVPLYIRPPDAIIPEVPRWLAS